MIQRVIAKRNVTESSVRDDLAFWRSRPPEERIAAVEILRRQHHGSTTRLQRSAPIIERAQYIKNKRSAGRKKDLADIEALGED